LKWFTYLSIISSPSKICGRRLYRLVIKVLKSITHCHVLKSIVVLGHSSSNIKSSIKRASSSRYLAFRSSYLLKPSSRYVLSDLDFILIFPWFENYKLLDVIMTSKFRSHLWVDQITKMVPFIHEWHKMLFVISNVVCGPYIIFNVSI
jgi:hypothetical protein